MQLICTELRILWGEQCSKTCFFRRWFEIYEKCFLEHVLILPHKLKEFYKSQYDKPIKQIVNELPHTHTHIQVQTSIVHENVAHIFFLPFFFENKIVKSASQILIENSQVFCFSNPIIMGFYKVTRKSSIAIDWWFFFSIFSLSLLLPI